MQRLGVARHPARPHFKDFVAGLVEDFTPLAGDRGFGEDAAIIGGFGRLAGRTVMLIGHEKGADTASRVAHNFGMGRPEGYRKAARLMAMADRFDVPVVTLIDTPGAYPGLEGEARGQAEAIARATQASLDLTVPMVAAITGEGMSGGAVGLAAANRVLMFEHAVYAVISPEGCASILWRGEPGHAADAAAAMKITASDLLRLGIIDRIVYEPPGGAHRDPATAIVRPRLGDFPPKLASLDGQSARRAAQGPAGQVSRHGAGALVTSSPPRRRGSKLPNVRTYGSPPAQGGRQGRRITAACTAPCPPSAMKRSIRAVSTGSGTEPSASTVSWKARMSNFGPSALSAFRRAARIAISPR